MDWRLLTARAALLALTACAPRSGAATPGEPGVLFQDDFSNPNSGWDVHSGADMTVNYTEGRYQIVVAEPGVDVWARPGLAFTD
jgi:hypothetical protein